MSKSQSYLTHRTSAEMRDYLKTYMMPTAKDSEVDLLLKYYPSDQRAGCPFDTGIKNARSTLIDSRGQNWVFI
jgi:hypothetical protein